MTTLQFTGELTVVECWCGMVHAVPTTLRDYQLRQHRDGKTYSVYCPLGHTYHPAGKAKYVTERERAEAAEATIRALQDQIDAAERERKRLAKRAAKGVCPCCKRSFVNVARHMAGQHPEYGS